MLTKDKKKKTEVSDSGWSTVIEGNMLINENCEISDITNSFGIFTHLANFGCDEFTDITSDSYPN